MHARVMDTGAQMLDRLTSQKERLASAVDTLQEALQQELVRRQELVACKEDLEDQLRLQSTVAMQVCVASLSCLACAQCPVHSCC